MEAIDHCNSLPRTRADNGILGRVPSQYIAQAGRTLPDPACALEDQMQVEIDADWAGRVRLTFRKQRYSRPRGKTSYYAWHCVFAESATGSPALAANQDAAEKRNPAVAGSGTRDAVSHAGLLREGEAGALGRTASSVGRQA